MKNDYEDIRERIATPPLWWDQDGVPRYCAFSPRAATIYASEVALLLIECQDCGRSFEVAMTWNAIDRVLHKAEPLSVYIKANAIHYGDPPNVRCCPAGPTMNSIPKRVLEFWRTTDAVDWERDKTLEVDIRCDWKEEG